MTAITIRLRDENDRQTIEAAKVATHQTTAAKALMRAARLYPEERTKLRAAELRISALQNDLKRLQSAIRDWQTARATERETAARLDDIITR